MPPGSVAQATKKEAGNVLAILRAVPLHTKPDAPLKKK